VADDTIEDQIVTIDNYLTEVEGQITDYKVNKTVDLWEAQWIRELDALDNSIENMNATASGVQAKVIIAKILA